MKALTLLLIPAALFAAQNRYARLGEFQGNVEVQLTPADPWIAAERNQPLTESAWIRTGDGARVEIELDDGGAWRLGPNALGEISDYTRLSTGQRVTLLSLDHGLAYFSGEPAGNDVLMLVAPGGQVSLGQGARVRVFATAQSSQFSVLEGMVRFSSPTAEMGLREGQSARVEPGNPQGFSLAPQILALALDKWSEDRDKAEAAPVSASHVTWHIGLADLDASGDWINNDQLGMVWKPRVPDGWTPYKNGRWRYTEALGYTWVSDDPWGWMPYHNGRWARPDNAGWVWQPAVSTIFKPGEVFWMYSSSAHLAGWGPLAPGEQWTPPAPGAVPPQYLAAATYAWLPPDSRSIDPAGFAPLSAQQLQSAIYAIAPPSPAFLAGRLDATRPILKVGATAIKPVVAGVTFTDPAEPPSALMTNPNDAQPPGVVISDASGGSVTPPPDGVYPVPVVTVPVVELPPVFNPPDHPDYARRNHSNGQTPPPAGGATTTGAQQTPPPVNDAAGPPSRLARPNGNQPVYEHAPPQTPPPPASTQTARPPAQPVPERRAPDASPAPVPHEAPRADPPRPTPPPAPAPPPPAPAVRETPKVEVPKVEPAKLPDKKGEL